MGTPFEGEYLYWIRIEY
ncbi:hypothetical protein A2U01_0084350, partial [Trifolium medium]|nr:hypothetical protein [Trifolium medium]